MGRRKFDRAAQGILAATQWRRLFRGNPQIEKNIERNLQFFSNDIIFFWGDFDIYIEYVYKVCIRSFKSLKKLKEVESILRILCRCPTEYSGKPRAASNPLNLKMKSGLYREPRILGTEFNKLVQALKDGRVGGDVESRANVRYLGLDLHATYLP